MNRRTAAGAIAALSLTLVIFLLAQWTGGASAFSQDDGQDELWRSSAAPTEGLTPAQLSPPDSPTAQTGREADNTPQSPEGVFLRDFRLAGSMLRPRASSVGYYWGAGGGCIYNSSGNPAEIWNVPVTLPEGATINTVRMYYDDNSDVNSTAWFTIYDLYGELVQEWAMTSSGNTGEGFADTPLIDHTIDYTPYSYVLNWRPTIQGATMQVCGFRIFYEAPPFGIGFLPFINN